MQAQVAAAYEKALEAAHRGTRSLSERLKGPALRDAFQRLSAFLADAMPKGLYARALIIIIAPIVLLESVVAFSFMERHWQSVTRRLSEATARDIAALIDVYESYGIDDNYARLIEMAREQAAPVAADTAPGRLCRRCNQSPSSRFSTARFRTRSESRSSDRSGSTPSGSPAMSKSASSTTMPYFASSPADIRPMPPTRTSS